jgi:MFS family permease
MSDRSELERRYRRLLAWYPAGHRRDHEEEMLGVLLAAARDGQRRPALADAVNLIGGGLRIRVRAGPARLDPRWRDALAVCSVAAPLLLLSVVAGALLGLTADHLGRIVSWWEIIPAVPVLLGPVVLLALVLFRLRRLAALASLVVTAGLVLYAVRASAYGSAGYMFWVALGALETASLVSSPSPRRGLELLGWRRMAAITIAAMAAGALLGAAVASAAVPLPVIRDLAVVLGSAAAAAVAIRSPAVGRRVLALLAIPACPLIIAVSDLTPAGPVTTGDLELIYLPTLVVLSLVLLASHRRHRGDPGPDAPHQPEASR